MPNTESVRAVLSQIHKNTRKLPQNQGKTRENTRKTRPKILKKVKGIKEFNIGHFLIGESIFEGLGKTIKQFKGILRK